MMLTNLHVIVCYEYIFRNSHLRFYYVLPLECIIFCVFYTILCILQININKKKADICGARCGTNIDFRHHLRVDLLFLGHVLGRSFLQAEERDIRKPVEIWVGTVMKPGPPQIFETMMQIVETKKCIFLNLQTSLCVVRDRWVKYTFGADCMFVCVCVEKNHLCRTFSYANIKQRTSSDDW